MPQQFVLDRSSSYIFKWTSWQWKKFGTGGLLAKNKFFLPFWGKFDKKWKLSI